MYAIANAPLGDDTSTRVTLVTVVAALLGGLAIYGLARYGNPFKPFGQLAGAITGGFATPNAYRRRRRRPEAWAVELYRTARQQTCSGGAIYKSKRRAKKYQKRKSTHWYTELKQAVW